jgi:hypothetical protein
VENVDFGAVSFRPLRWSGRKIADDTSLDRVLIHLRTSGRIRRRDHDREEINMLAKFCPILLLLLLAAGPLGAAEADNPPPVPRTPEEAEAQRRKADAMRKEAERRYAEEEAGCYRRIRVNDCRDEARERRTKTLVEARRIDAPAMEFQRESKRGEIEAEKDRRADERSAREARQKERAASHRAEESAKAAERDRKRLDKERKAEEKRKKRAGEEARRRLEAEKRAQKRLERSEKKARERARAEAAGADGPRIR